MKKDSVLFTQLFIESIAEEYNIDERNFLKKAAATAALGASLYGGGLAYKNIANKSAGVDKVQSVKNEKKINHSEFLLKQAFVESGLNSEAISPKGAKGLTQIMPSALQDYLKSTGKKIEDVNLFDIKHSVDIQIKTMQSLYNSTFIEKENQSEIVRLAKTLAAYNWGRGNMANFLKKLKDQGEDIYNSLTWVEKLPEEPKNYINKILLKKDKAIERQYQEAIKDPENKSIVSLYKKDINLEK